MFCHLRHFSLALADWDLENAFGPSLALAEARKAKAKHDRNMANMANMVNMVTCGQSIRNFVHPHTPFAAEIL